MAGVKGPQVPPLYEEILRRARELPGAAEASFSGWPLMRGLGFKNTMGPAGSKLTPEDRLNISLNFVSETHFKNMGMREIAPPTFFSAFNDDAELVTLHVRTRRPEAEMMREIRAMLSTIGPGLTPVDIATMEQEIETSLWQERMLSFLSQVFAGLAGLIAGIGLFGMISYTLARSTREVGIRVAIGAPARGIAGLFAAHAALAVAPGILLGCIGFAPARRPLEPLLFGESAATAVPLLASGLMLGFVTVVALVVPLARAIRIQPSVALREE